MKDLPVLLVAIIAVTMATTLDLDDPRWVEFKAKHEKTYPDATEEERRLQVFLNNLERIEAHNRDYAAGKTTYKMGINQFSDMEKDEFQKHHVGGYKSGRNSELPR